MSIQVGLKMSQFVRHRFLNGASKALFSTSYRNAAMVNNCRLLNMQLPRINVTPKRLLANETTNKSGLNLNEILAKQVNASQGAAETAKTATTAQPEGSQTPPNDQQQQQQGDKKKGRFSYLFEKEHVWKLSFGIVVMMLTSMGGYVLLEWGAPERDINGNVAKDEFSDLPAWIQYPKRAYYAVINYYEMFKEPASKKLLPEPLEEPYYQPPYTLIVELNGIIVHPEWTYNHGWRYKKRPGMDYFVDQLKYPMFELILITNESFMSIDPVIRALDPNGNFQFKLYRESTKFMNGVHVKDLSCINRDPKKIILIDWDEKAYQLQPRNALHRLKKWKGEDDDTDLVYLATFLKTIAASGVEDVRDVLDYYNKEIDPLETFKMNQVKLLQAEEERKKLVKEAKQSKNPFSWARRQF